KDFIFSRDIFWKIESEYIREHASRPGSVAIIKRVSPVLTMATVIGEAILESDMDLDLKKARAKFRKLSKELDEIIADFSDDYHKE
ncbi:MAG: hypothetical protein ACTSW4_03860, partial [Candidatus Ranarchaeia archaeon]